LNRAQLTWTPVRAFSITGGRQRILIDDQRFVGNVNWRQNEQTFDGVRADITLGGLKLFGAYVSHVNRVLGEYRNFDSASYLMNARYDVSKTLDVEGFAYLLEFQNSPVNSSRTEGVRVSGKFDLAPLKVAYGGTYAHQGDYGNAPTPFGLDFYDVDLAGTYGIATLRLNYQQLAGNGTRGFTTPLATTHSFQGWADAFVSPGGNKSFVDGIDDYNLSLTLRPKVKPAPFFSRPEIVVWYHDFEDELHGSHIGQELDVSGSVNLTNRLVLLVKYADFRRAENVPLGAATPPASRTKAWVSLEFKL
jgi:hypothetical protein